MNSYCVFFLPLCNKLFFQKYWLWVLSATPGKSLLSNGHSVLRSLSISPNKFRSATAKRVRCEARRLINVYAIYKKLFYFKKFLCQQTTKVLKGAGVEMNGYKHSIALFLVKMGNQLLTMKKPLFSLSESRWIMYLYSYDVFYYISSGPGGPVYLWPVKVTQFWTRISNFTMLKVNSKYFCGD